MELAGVGGGSTAMIERLSAKICAGTLYMLTLILTPNYKVDIGPVY